MKPFSVMGELKQMVTLVVENVKNAAYKTFAIEDKSRTVVSKPKHKTATLTFFLCLNQETLSILW